MSFIAAAIVGGGAIIGGIISSNGAQSAADTQANAAMNAQNISQQEFNTITGQEQPYMNAGYGAQSQLNYLLGIGSPGSGLTTGGTGGGQPAQPGFDPSSGYGIGAGGGIYRGLLSGSGLGGAGGGRPGMASGGQGMQGGTPATASGSPAGGYGSLLTPFSIDNWKQLSPAYQFQQQQGMQGVLNSDASGSGALSGAAQKDLISYNQNLANTSFNNAFNQYQTQQGNIYSRLAGISQLGQNAASNTGAQGTALAGQAAQSATNVGSALAAGQVGSANAWSSAIGNASGALPWLTSGGGGGGFTPNNANESTSGAAYDSLYSDRRLKKNIRRIGMTPAGQPWYEFEYTFEPGRRTGVMADESPPEAVSYDAAGFARVDYARIR